VNVVPKRLRDGAERLERETFVFDPRGAETPSATQGKDRVD